MKDIIKDFNLLDATRLAVAAWETVSSQTILSCWAKLIDNSYIYQSRIVNRPNENPSASTTIVHELSAKVMNLINPQTVLSKDDIDDWIKNSDNAATSQIYSDVQLAAYVSNGTLNPDSEGSDTDQSETEAVPRLTQPLEDVTIRNHLRGAVLSINSLMESLNKLNDEEKLQILEQWKVEYEDKIIQLM